jgi:glycosyltransferase involved in cell wall biosynthesis
LFCHYLTSYGLIGALLKSSYPLVIWLHGTDILVTPDRSLLYRLMARYALARSDLIIMAAAHMKQRVQQLAGAGKRSIVAPVGVDLASFNQAKTSERKELSCISNRRLVENSNVDVILEALARVSQVQPGVRLTVVGGGPLKADLENMVRRLHLTSWVTFLGEIPNETMPDLLRQHSVYLATTSSDGTSISLLEAMACGAFPIVSDIPANQPWITSGTNGFLALPREPDVFARRILEAFARPSLISSARPINWEIVKERGDYTLNMERVEQAVKPLSLARTRIS